MLDHELERARQTTVRREQERHAATIAAVAIEEPQQVHSIPSPPTPPAITVHENPVVIPVYSSLVPIPPTYVSASTAVIPLPIAVL